MTGRPFPARRPASIVAMDGRARLRVCIVTRVVNGHGIGGMQQHTEDLSRGLVAAGHRVTVLTSRLPAGVRPPDDGAEWRLADVQKPDKPYSRAWGRASVAAYRAAAEEEPFDVVHSESAGALGLLKMRALRWTPLVVAFHGNAFGYIRAQLLAGRIAPNPAIGLARGIKRSLQMCVLHYGQGHGWAYRDSEAIVVSRAHLRDTIRSSRLDPKRTHVVPNGVDVAAFRPGRAPERRAGWSLPPGGIAILTLGRLASDKGVDVAIRALVELPEAVTLIVAGSGAHEGELRALAGRLGVSGRLRFIGGVPQDEVPEVMRAADVFWFPTVRDEAAPLVLPQAMACGLPVVTSRIGGIPDYVALPGEEAVLVEPRDVRGLVAATWPLVVDAGRREELGAAARRRVVAEFSLERMVERTLDVYRRAIARAGGGSPVAAGVGGHRSH